MKILVTGGRDFLEQQLAFDQLDRLHAQTPIQMLLHGGAKGADALAASWASARGIPSLACQADWSRFGKGAGFKANEELLDKHQPDLVVAFPGGKGTAHMVKLAKAKGVRVVEVNSQ